MFKDDVVLQLSKPISSVSDYIAAIKIITDKKQASNRIFVYRGETQRYENSFCTPNIFRRNYLSSNFLYEKGLFNSMRQNKLTHTSSYLENAIDAQHGEFPSRLLDVSYNCLMALYFAVTPYYHKSSDAFDDVDGMVYVFYIDDIYSPSATNTTRNYDAIINKNISWFSGQAIFQKNHKFIDHAKLNNRIIAQQGAFILFQGDDAEKIPTHMMNGLIIPSTSKKAIREELSIMFGINTGSVYPEIVNLVADITDKSRMLITEDFTWQSEIRLVIKTLKKELDYFTTYLKNYDKDKNKLEFYEAIQLIEHIINSYRVGLIKFYNDFPTFNIDNYESQRHDLKQLLNIYDETINSFRSDMLILYNSAISEGLNINLKEE